MSGSGEPLPEEDAPPDGPAPLTPRPKPEPKEWMFQSRGPYPKPEPREQFYGDLQAIGLLLLSVGVILAVLMGGFWVLETFPAKPAASTGPCQPVSRCTEIIGYAGNTYVAPSNSSLTYVFVLPPVPGNASTWTVTGSWNSTEPVAMFVLDTSEWLNWTNHSAPPASFQWATLDSASGVIDASIPAGQNYLVWMDQQSVSATVAFTTDIVANPSA